MIAVDTNVLVYAHRREMAKHPQALALLTDLAEGDAPWGLPVFVVNEFLRVVTHRRVFPVPTTRSVATGVISALVASPTARVLHPGGRYLKLLEQTIEEGDAQGNLVLDAAIVALCREHGVDTVVTANKDFHRFPSVKVVPV